MDTDLHSHTRSQGGLPIVATTTLAHENAGARVPAGARKPTKPARVITMSLLEPKTNSPDTLQMLFTSL